MSGGLKKVKGGKIDRDFGPITSGKIPIEYRTPEKIVEPTRKQLKSYSEMRPGHSYEVTIDTGTGKISKVVGYRRATELVNYYTSYNYPVEVEELE